MKHINKKTRIIAAVSMLFLIVSIVIIIFINKKTKQLQDQQKQEDDLDDEIKSLENGGSNKTFPLIYNPHISTQLVKSLQEKLNDRLKGWTAPLTFPTRTDGSRIESLKVDGYFGPETLAVVKFVWNQKTQVTEEMFNSL